MGRRRRKPNRQPAAAADAPAAADGGSTQAQIPAVRRSRRATRCPPAQGPPWRSSRSAVLVAGALVVMAAMAAYANSFQGLFVFDDDDSIGKNATIRELGQMGRVFSPPHEGETVSGRPVLNLSFAVNYALGGTDPWGYHAVNLSIHIVAALLLLGIVRRSFLLPALRDRFGRAATPLATAVALLWAVHPLQTESVTYIVQRAESMAGLFYFLTLYCTLRGATSSGNGTRGNPLPLPKTVGGMGERLWYTAAVIACLLGVCTKETVATAPLLVLVYDRTFQARSFTEALRRRWALYAGLAATWGVLAHLVLATDQRGGTAGFGAPAALGAWEYIRSEPAAILHYLRLSLWPHPLCLDYGPEAIVRSPVAVVGTTAATGSLLAATAWGLGRRKGWAFLGGWFFLILAPSSLVPLQDPAFEHRMYLPLAAVVTGMVLGVYLVTELLVRRRAMTPWASGVAGVCLTLVACLVLGGFTFRRNAVYHSDLSLWEDTVAKAPGNPRPHVSLGTALAGRKRLAEAVAEFQIGLRIRPGDAVAHYNLGNALRDQKRAAEAITHYQKALELRPRYVEAHDNLGSLLQQQGRLAEAIAQFQRAVEIDPSDNSAYSNLGNVFWQQGKAVEAVAEYQKVLQTDPHDTRTINNLGTILGEQGRLAEAVDVLQKALQIDPNDPVAHYNLANVFVRQGKAFDAIAQYHAALELRPNYVKVHNNLGSLLAQEGRLAEAIAHFRTAAEIQPGDTAAYYNLGRALEQRGSEGEAAANYQKAVEVDPHHAEAHYHLGVVLRRQGRFAEALAQWRETIRLRPGAIVCLKTAAWVLATNPDASVRNGAEAVELAQRAARLSRDGDPAIPDTLAAAYAEAGQFPEAIRAAQQALDLAKSQHNSALVDTIAARIKLYRAGAPFREAP